MLAGAAAVTAREGGGGSGSVVLINTCSFTVGLGAGAFVGVEVVEARGVREAAGGDDGALPRSPLTRRSLARDAAGGCCGALEGGCFFRPDCA